MPQWLAGFIVIIGAITDSLSIASVIENHKVLAIVLIGLRAGIHKFEELYNNGLQPKSTPEK